MDLKDDELSAPQCCSMCVQCVYHLYACTVAMYTRYCVFIHPIQCPHVLMCQELLHCAPSLPAEWSLVDANQGYTGGVEWEEE